MAQRGAGDSLGGRNFQQKAKAMDSEGSQQRQKHYQDKTDHAHHQVSGPFPFPLPHPAVGISFVWIWQDDWCHTQIGSVAGISHP